MPSSENLEQRHNIKSQTDRQILLSVGNLYERFRPYFDILISQENMRRVGLSFEDTYVPVPKVEAALAEHLSTPTGQMTVLTGNRGIGKSTILRKMFGPISIPSLIERRLIVPFLLDATQYSQVEDGEKLIEAIIDAVTSQLDAASDTLASGIPDFVHVESDFYKFINTHAPRLLKSRKLRANSSFEERLEFLKENKPLAYYAELVKYRSRNSVAERIVFLIDNIEHIDPTVQKRFVESIISLRNCFYNTTDADLEYVVDIALTCRPETLEYFRHNGNIKGWSTPKKVAIVEPVDLSLLLEKRLQNAIELIGSAKKGTLGRLQNVADVESWRSAYLELLKILTAMSERHGKIVVELANLDLRLSMDFLFHTLKNSRWFYHGAENVGGAFDDIREQDYRASYAGFFRALILRDSDLYESQSNEVIGNVFYNTEDEPEADLMCFYIALYMQKFALRRAISKKQITDALAVVYDRAIIDRCIGDRISAMENSGLIYHDRIVFELEHRNEDGYLATERLNAVMYGLKESSMFLEFYRDDVWISRKALGTIAPTSSVDGKSKFLHTIRMIAEFLQIEMRLLRTVSSAGKADIYEKYFGKKRIGQICLDGFLSSTSKYYKDRNTGKTDIPTPIKNMILEVKGTLQAMSLK
jgi:energy-coupling factor transporter ATP-binding protein EcfA2